MLFDENEELLKKLFKYSFLEDKFSDIPYSDENNLFFEGEEEIKRIEFSKSYKAEVKLKDVKMVGLAKNICVSKIRKEVEFDALGYVAENSQKINKFQVDKINILDAVYQASEIFLGDVAFCSSKVFWWISVLAPSCCKSNSLVQYLGYDFVRCPELKDSAFLLIDRKKFFLKCKFLDFKIVNSENSFDDVARLFASVNFGVVDAVNWKNIIE
jgi:hypothetical protein